MSRFTKPLRIEDTGRDVNGRGIWRVIDAYDYEVGAKGSGLIIHVPLGFETDFASVPRMFWRVFTPWGEYRKAAVLHDYLYRKASGFSKTLGDAIFLEAMEELGVPKWKRLLIYWAVSFFGHSSYNWEAPSPPHTEVKMLDADASVKPEFIQPKATDRLSAFLSDSILPKRSLTMRGLLIAVCLVVSFLCCSTAAAQQCSGGSCSVSGPRVVQSFRVAQPARRGFCRSLFGRAR